MSAWYHMPPRTPMFSYDQMPPPPPMPDQDACSGRRMRRSQRHTVDTVERDPRRAVVAQYYDVGPAMVQLRQNLARRPYEWVQTNMNDGRAPSVTGGRTPSVTGVPPQHSYYRPVSASYGVLNERIGTKLEGDMFPQRPPETIAGQSGGAALRTPEDAAQLHRLIQYVNHGGELLGQQSFFIDAPEDPAKYRDPIVWTADLNPILEERRRMYGQEPDPTAFYHSRQALVAMLNEDRTNAARDPWMRRVTNTARPDPRPRSGGDVPAHIAAEILDSLFESQLN